MSPRERVIAVIEHRKPDRIPVYGWLKENLDKPICETFGSVEAFEDMYEFDLAHLFGGPHIYPADSMEAIRRECGGNIDPSILLDIPLSDPNNFEDYQVILDQIKHHKQERGRFVYVQTPGVFECYNEYLRIENHLTYLVLYEKELHQLYCRQAEWNRSFALNCLDLGVDMIHVSDDWGSQNNLLFSPTIWWKLIYPYHKITTEAVKRRNGYLSLHSDGYIMPIMDGVIDLNYDVVHPWQESAGMDLDLFKRQYKSMLTVMGGLDVQTTIGFGHSDKLRAEIERIVQLFSNGGLLLCTTHFIQPHCSIEELVFAYDFIYDLIRKSGI